MTTSSVISSKGQIVIPAALRKKYCLKAGVRVAFREERGRLVLEPNSFDAFRALRGTIDAPLLQWLEEDRAAERLREDAR